MLEVVVISRFQIDKERLGKATDGVFPRRVIHDWDGNRLLGFSGGEGQRPLPAGVVVRRHRSVVSGGPRHRQGSRGGPVAVGGQHGRADILGKAHVPDHVPENAQAAHDPEANCREVRVARDVDPECLTGAECRKDGFPATYSQPTVGDGPARDSTCVLIRVCLTSLKCAGGLHQDEGIGLGSIKRAVRRRGEVVAAIDQTGGTREVELLDVWKPAHAGCPDRRPHGRVGRDPSEQDGDVGEGVAVGIGAGGEFLGIGDANSRPFCIFLLPRVLDQGRRRLRPRRRGNRHGDQQQQRRTRQAARPGGAAVGGDPCEGHTPRPAGGRAGRVTGSVSTARACC